MPTHSLWGLQNDCLKKKKVISDFWVKTWSYILNALQGIGGLAEAYGEYPPENTLNPQEEKGAQLCLFLEDGGEMFLGIHSLS